jgi:hypothetical protein
MNASTQAMHASRILTIAATMALKTNSTVQNMLSWSFDDWTKEHTAYQLSWGDEQDKINAEIAEMRQVMQTLGFTL